MDLKHLLQQEYGLEVAEVSQLESYADDNHLIIAEGGSRYVLKIHKETSKKNVELQNGVQKYLVENGFNVPHVIVARSGQSSLDIQEKGQSYIVRLLRFIDGNLLGNIREPSPKLMKNFGRFLGKMDAIMTRYDGRVDFPSDYWWDLKNLLDCKRYLPCVESVEKKRLISYFILQFEELVLPNQSTFIQSVIHNDPNPWNILVTGQEISGIIDFGDMVYTSRIYNPAIALTYLLFGGTQIMEKASAFIEGYHKELPLTEMEIGSMYYLIAGRLCNSLCISSFKAQEEPENTYAFSDHDSAWQLLQTWITINPAAFEEQLRGICNLPGMGDAATEEMQSKRHRYFSKNLSLSYEKPIHVTKAAMQYMYDGNGNAYLDGVNNICHVGHCHPKVVEAAKRQISILNTNTRYLYDSLYEYAEDLLSTFPKELNKVFFVNSGSAATDLARRMAIIHTGKDGVAVLDGAYHGNTMAAMDISPYKHPGRGGEGPKPHIFTLTMPDSYRGPFRSINSGADYAKELEQLLDQNSIGCFIAESLMGCGGQIVLPPSFLTEAYRLTRQNGGICIADEVQVGFGRVGEKFWGFELYGVIPDIVILGKPMGNGHPIGAVVCRDEICHSFENGIEFFSSFGGNPVSCEIGKAVLEVIREEGLQKHAFSMGKYICGQWNQLMEEHACVGDVRGKGLFLGMEIVSDPTAKKPDPVKARKIVEYAKENYILLSTDGPDNNVIKFKPPMVFNQSNADLLYNVLGRALTTD